MKIKSKKATEISPPNLVVVIVLCLMILLILLFIFAGQSKSFTEFITNIAGQAKGEKCQSAVFMRYCDKCPSDDYTVKQILPLPPGKEKWSDCTGSCVECVSKETG